MSQHIAQASKSNGPTPEEEHTPAAATDANSRVIEQMAESGAETGPPPNSVVKAAPQTPVAPGGNPPGSLKALSDSWRENPQGPASIDLLNVGNTVTNSALGFSKKAKLFDPGFWVSPQAGGATAVVGNANVGLSMSNERRYATTLDGDATLTLNTGYSAMVGVNGKGMNIAYQESESQGGQVFAQAGEDGVAPSEQALAQNLAIFSNRGNEDRPTTTEEMNAAIAAARGMKDGDYTRTQVAAEHGIDGGVGGMASVSAGVSEGRVQRREVRSAGDGLLQISVAEADSAGVRGGVGAAFGMASVSVGSGNTDAQGQTVMMNIEKPEGQRDFILNQFGGLLPGAAAALGLETLKDAQDFIAAGGMAGAKLPENLAGMDAATLNAILVDSVENNPELAQAWGYAQVDASRERQSTVDFGVAGFSLYARKSTESNGTSRQFNAKGELSTTFTSAQTYDRNGLLVDDGDYAVRAAANGQQMAMLQTTTLDPDAGMAEGVMAEALQGNDEALGALVDHPELRTTLTGNTEAFFDAVAQTDTAPSPELLASVFAELQNAKDGINMTTLTPGSRAALAETAEAKGVSIGELLTGRAGTYDSDGEWVDGTTGVMQELGTVKRGDATLDELSPEARRVYAALALGEGHPDRLDALRQVGTDPDERAYALTMVAQTGGSEGVTDLAAWAEEQGEAVASTLNVKTEMVAGSTSAIEAVGGKATAFLGQLGNAALAPELLDQVLTGLDQQLATEDSGGITQLLTNMSPDDVASFLRKTGDSPVVRARVLALVGSRPDLLIPQDVMPEDRVLWAQENLVDGMGLQLSAEEVVAQAQELELAERERVAQVIAQQNAGLADVSAEELGASLKVRLRGPLDVKVIDALLTTNTTRGAEGVTAVLDVFGQDTGEGTTPVGRLVDLAARGGAEHMLRLFESVQGTVYEAQIIAYLDTNNYLWGEDERAEGEFAAVLATMRSAAPAG